MSNPERTGKELSDVPPNPPSYYSPPPHNPGFDSTGQPQQYQQQPMPVMTQPMPMSSSNKIGTVDYRNDAPGTLNAGYNPGPYNPGSYNPQGHSPNFQPIYQPQSMQMGVMGPPPIIVPIVPTNVPQGLAYLACLDRVFIRQKIELLEIVSGCETQNKYKILDPQGQHIFSAKEDTDCLTRNCLGAIRPFDIVIKDGLEQEVIHLSRPFACGSCCYPCCLQSIDVEAPPGNLVGRIEQDWTLWIPKYRVLNAEGEVVLRIKGPVCTVSCFNDVDFQILSKDGSTEVGKISKQWSGLVKEYFTDADNFGISFPIDLDVKMKAVMIGAALLIDFMFFERNQNNNNNHHHN